MILFLYAVFIFPRPSISISQIKNDLDIPLKGKFYIYDWPTYLSDVYPPLNAVLDPDTSYDHTFNYNDGAGRMLMPDIGLFQTWQFSLYKNLISRLMTSQYRTLDPSEANSFIVPFDAGVHSYIDHLNGKRRLASPHGWTAIQLLQKASQDNYFWKLRGHNHFVLFSLTEFTMTGIGVKEFWMGICQNCTALTIEATPTKTSTLYHRSRKYWYPVPYPSSFHWWEGIKILPWLADPQSHHRHLLAVFIGSLKTLNIDSNAFRRILWTQCLQQKISLPNNNNDRLCQWFNTSHSCNGLINATESLLLLRSAKFCLAPPGDTVTRKSLFDSLLAGCVPVIFAKASLAQYGWHLSTQDIEDIAVYIPRAAILDQKVNFLDVLKAITPQELRRKQLAIEKVAPRLQFSLTPADIQLDRQKKENKRKSGENSTSPLVIWDSPVYDAVDVIIEHLLNRSTVEPLNGFTDEELRLQKCRQNVIVRHHPDYAGLFRSGTRHLVPDRLWKKFRCEDVEAAMINETMKSIG